MKIIISESKLNVIIFDYLDTLLLSKGHSRVDSFIIIHDNYGDTEFYQQMEYDFFDGRLWVSEKFLKTFMDLFGTDKDMSLSLIGRWFEKKFLVDIKYYDSD